MDENEAKQVAMSDNGQEIEERNIMRKLLSTHLNCSLLMVALSENALSKYTTAVVKTEKKAPKPKTTRYPTYTGRGGAPPK